ncbi:hypothetical protein ACN2WE_01380 [Streptomyces sp. cg28]|uniref:hypothetical protein n=1 Tax=unclassified Streptomyces TaxID=2593676 RepID=UPI000DBAC0EE|nr:MULTISPECIES: hypothetical protein [unclassified Streptomyces]MYT69104.1 hypothetical protein [Streptomyces sp. SID8367]RAJ82615.1 hypothetical protein K377_04335 [Streptomyces sp. PsTaAH-137]
MTTPLIERLATTVRDSAQPVTDADRADLAELLPLAQVYAETCGIGFDDVRSLALAVHALAFVRRVRGDEHLDALDEELGAEIAPGRMAAVRTLVDAYCEPRGFSARDTEILLLALHFEAAAQLQHQTGRQA